MTFLSPSRPSVAVVEMPVTWAVVVYLPSSMSAWATSSTFFSRLSNATISVSLRDAGGVEGEGHLDLAVSLLGRESGLCGDGLAVHLRGFSVTCHSSSVTFT